MSTAILISGQLRTFAQCYPTQRWHVLRHFADPHFFITVQDAGHTGILSQLVSEWGEDHVHLDLRTDPDLSADLTPALTAAYHQAPYTNAAPAHQLLLQHWYQNECWKHFVAVRGQLSAGSSEPQKAESRSLIADRCFDTIIRLRPDLWFHSFDFDVERSVFNVECSARSAWTPWWGQFGGINDRFALMGPEAARYYFTVYEAIPELLAAGCPFHPESLVAANLDRAGNIDVHPTLRTEFTTYRLNGPHRPPEITGWDIAHAALRAAA